MLNKNAATLRQMKRKTQSPKSRVRGVRMPDKLWADVKVAAKSKRETPSDLIRRAAHNETRNSTARAAA